jgi:hypothetical protein
MSNTKISVEIDEIDLDMLQAIADTENSTLDKIIQKALHEYVTAKIYESGFRQKAEAAKKRSVARFDRLLHENNDDYGTA